jgi:hypothetical protein
MVRDSFASCGAATGAVAIGLFAVAAVLTGDGPAMSASGREVAAFYDQSRTQIQIGCALIALSAPLLVWFLGSVAGLSREAGPQARLGAVVAFGCGLAFLALFLADVTTVAVGALRPQDMVADPELARALRDFEWLAIAMATFLGSGLLVALAVLALSPAAIWPRWVGWLAAIAAVAYGLRIGALFTTEGPFSASGLLGLYLPVAALAGWIFLASVSLTLNLRRAAARLPNLPKSSLR